MEFFMTEITADNLAAAENLLGITYTPAERAMMLDNLAPQIEDALRRRALPFGPSDGPATRFDPRLPGFTLQQCDAFAWLPSDANLPAGDDDIAFAPIALQAGWIKSRKISSKRLIQLYLDRIGRLNPRLFCYATVTAESALRRAAELDAMTAENIWLGPLHGIPYGLKDIFDTAGVETAWGAEPYRNRIPETDAHIVTSLHAAGAVMLGKTTVGALAYGDLWYGGRTRNPWNPDEGSSGSSAGSAAAVAAGLAGFCIGTETLGSIVSPATRCGTVGLRPTFGRVSRTGAMPLCWSLDKIGPICRSVIDAALILDAINQPDRADPFQIAAPFGQRGPAGTYRLGYFPVDFADKEARNLDQDALRAAKNLGFELVELQRPDRPYDSLMAILFAEAAAAFEDLTLSNRDDELTWQDADAWPNSFRKARFLSAVDHVQADRLRRLIMQDMDKAFVGVDAIIGPSLAGPMLTITNFTGHPSLCLPAGMFRAATRDPVSLARNTALPDPTAPQVEVPHSICLYGRLFDEATLIAIGQALETLSPFGTRRPPI
jgi:Asp-tRNA(Asn)/Glu-tRNA(Gln) amidotransferase A subunit family amidase